MAGLVDQLRVDLDLCAAGLDFGCAIPADEAAGLVDAPGLYSIWEYSDSPRLLYVGKAETQTIRRRVGGYLSGRRPNETLYLHILNQVLRPNMQLDDRRIDEIAIDYLRSSCYFGEWAWDGVTALHALESQLIRGGVWGAKPLLNYPMRRSSRRSLI